MFDDILAAGYTLLVLAVPAGFSMNLTVLSGKWESAEGRGRDPHDRRILYRRLIAQAVTSVAGSSDWFERGYVAYSNAAKCEALGVSRRTLARHGAVSEQTARRMARGA